MLDPLTYFRIELARLAAFFDLTNSEGRKRSAMTGRKLFSEILQCADIRSFLEIGAHTAEMSIFIKKSFPSVECIAFEANPHNFNHFLSRFDYASHQVQYKNIAISNIDGRIRFRLQRKKMGNEISYIRGNNSLLTRIENDVEYEDVSVPSYKLDTILRTVGRSALWVDVEGANRLVFEDSTFLSKLCRVIHVEVEEKSYWHDQWLASDVINHMITEGFVPVFRDFEYEYQYNVIFVHKDLIGNAEFQKLYCNFFSNLSTGGFKSEPQHPPQWMEVEG